MRKWLALLFACLVLTLVAVGCGGDDDEGGGGGVDETAQEEPPADSGESSGGGGAQVGMKNIQFEPGDVTIKTGESVTWTNDEAVPHDVEGGGGDVKFSSGAEGGMNDGDEFTFTFKKAGTYDYICRVHAPGMAGTVTVK